MSGLINKIRVHQLRGVKDIEIPLAGGNLLILGENGTGKSSIIDSLELFFTEQIEKIAGRQDVPLKDAIPFQGSDNERWVEIELEGEPELIRLDYSSSSKRSVIPASYVNFFEIASIRSFILHRYQLLAFVEDRAAGRYKRLSTLIGMDFMDEVVDSWKQANHTFEKNYKNAGFEESSALKELQDWLKKKTSSYEEVCNEVNQTIIPLGLPSISKRIEIAERQNALKGKFVRPVNFVRAEALRTILTRMEETALAFNAFLVAYESLFFTWQSFLEQSSSVSDAAYENILVDGKKVINELSLDVCPLCEAEIKDRAKLLGRIDYRLGELHALIHARQKMESERSKVKKSLFGAQENINRLGDSLAAGAMQNIEGMLGAQNTLKDIESKLECQPLVLNSIDSAKKMFELFYAALQETRKSISAEVQSLNPNDDEKKILDANNFLARTDEKWQDWEEKYEFAQIELIKCEQTKIVYQQLIEARRNGIQSILNGLQAEFISMYNFLHPKEGHKAISILMSENKDNSADLLAEMDGMKPLHPLAHYSEGHLDSMGLCIFLALIKKFNGDLKLLILDDVLTSIDAGHRLRVAQLIAKEFEDYQIIITTHDEFWANELATIFKNNMLPLKSIRMNPWKQKDGATYNDYTSISWDYYLGEISQGRIQDAVAGVGRNLEKFLYTMRKNLHIGIPATFDDRYTIGDLYEPFFTWVDKHPINRPDMVDHNQRLSILKEELDDYWRFRNWSGAHYNDWGASISEAEASTFVELVRELVLYLQCPACSTLVIYDTSKKVIHCPNCKPTPSSRAVWVYKSDWKQRVLRLKAALGVPDKDIKLINISQAALDNYLKDVRRKLGLTLPATANDEYGLPEIYDFFIEFVKTHPRYDDVDAKEKTLLAIEILAEFISPEKNWVDPQVVREKSENLLSATMQLIELLECSSCGEITHFDQKNQSYFCAKCDKQEIVESPGAHWITE